MYEELNPDARFYAGTAASGGKNDALGVASSGAVSVVSEPRRPLFESSEGALREAPKELPLGTSLRELRLSEQKREQEQLQRAQDARFQRYQRRQKSSEWLIGDAREAVGLPRYRRPEDPDQTWVRPLRPARCRWRIGADVGLHLREGTDDAPIRRAHWSGLERCASIWACPVCSAVIRNHRAVEITRMVKNGEDMGLNLIFITMTLRHKWGDALSGNLDALLTGWRKLQTWSAYRKLIKRYSIIHLLRGTEITLSRNAGYHPHNHFLAWSSEELSVQDVEQFQNELGALWIKLCTKIGVGVPTAERGIKAVKVEAGGTVIAQYISKLQETGEYKERNTSIGLELARGDLKSGRMGSILPFELLDAAEEGSSLARDLWLEYVHATRGRRAFSYSRGLRDLLLPDEDELSDEEVIQEVEAGDLVLTVPGEYYDRVFKNDPQALSGALDLVELGLADFLYEEFPEPEPPPPPQGQASGQSTA